jgi:hypothetical protein
MAVLIHAWGSVTRRRHVRLASKYSSEGVSEGLSV